MRGDGRARIELTGRCSSQTKEPLEKGAVVVDPHCIETAFTCRAQVAEFDRVRCLPPKACAELKLTSALPRADHRPLRVDTEAEPHLPPALPLVPHPPVCLLASANLARRTLTRHHCSFAGSIVTREVACWKHYAAVVDHFQARLELALYLEDTLVHKEAYTPIERVELRNEDAEVDIERKVLRGLLSPDERLKVLAKYDRRVEKIGRGEARGYEQWRAKEESRAAWG